jgi:uncharacterized cysteine cluster protein YcgN (CxxCxxCC family)
VNLPPPIMWDHTRTEWDATALVMLEAFQQYSDSLCSGCAQSAFHALDIANTREFSVGTVTCLGCNVRETWQANHGDERTKGEKLYVKNGMSAAEPDPDGR